MPRGGSTLGMLGGQRPSGWSRGRRGYRRRQGESMQRAVCRAGWAREDWILSLVDEKPRRALSRQRTQSDLFQQNPCGRCY